MTCYHPLSAHRITYSNGNVKMVILGSVVNQNLKKVLKWREKKTWSQGENLIEYMELSCGQCIGCRLDRSREWACRCVEEAQCHEKNMFLTLTYDERFLPRDGSLSKSELQKFWKRLRKEFHDVKIRYFACGEYGTKLSRPHYHAIVFGLWPDDATLWTIRSGNRLFVSPTVARLWPFGFHSIGYVTFDSAAYVARYVLKKVNGDNESHYDKKIPEFVTMSRRPGIGHDWLMKFHDDVYPHDYVVIKDGIKARPPRYYDKIYDVELDGDLESLRNKRRDNMTFQEFDVLDRKEKHKKILITKKLRRILEE